MSRMSELHAEIMELFEAGVLYLDIAEKLNIPVEMVYDALDIDLEEK
ncbi:MAG: hypothetical protein ACO21G_09265 [Algoriphagus sp.]